jgi:ATP-binding cassette subfamily C (CFTR/MRP) protein 10
MKVYMSYFEAPGMKLSVLILTVTFLMQASANSIAFWYAYWAAHTADFTPNQFIFYSGILVIANVVFALLRSFLFAYGGMVAAKKIFPNLEIRGSSIFMNNKLLFDSTSPQCVEAFLFGLMIGKTQKD